MEDISSMDFYKLTGKKKSFIFYVCFFNPETKKSIDTMKQYFNLTWNLE